MPMSVAKWAKEQEMSSEEATTFIDEFLDREVTPRSKLSDDELEQLEVALDEEDELEEDEDDLPNSTDKDPYPNDTEEPITPLTEKESTRIRELKSLGVKHPIVSKADTQSTQKTFSVACRGHKDLPTLTIDAGDESEAIRQFILMTGVTQTSTRYNFVASLIT
jgi:hypothetical protein